MIRATFNATVLSCIYEDARVRIALLKAASSDVTNLGPEYSIDVQHRGMGRQFL